MTQVPETGLRVVLAAELTAAMGRRDGPRLRVLRSALAAIANAEAVPVDQAPAAGAIELAPHGAGASEVARRVLDEATVRAVVAAEISELDSAGRRLAEVGNPVRAADLRRDADVLRGLLNPPP